MREIILDTETTGLSVKEGHRIVEIGCIEIENYLPTKKIFHCYLNPERKVSQKALEVHGYSHELEIVGKDKIDIKNTLDTLEVARDKFPGSAASLDALCKKFRIDNSKREKHTALIDCELLYKVYINLFNQKEPSLDFSSENEKVLKFDKTRSQEYFKGLVVPSSEELNDHKNFIKNSLKKNNF